MSRELSYSAKVVSGNLCPRGRAKILLNISKDTIATSMRLPGDTPMKMENVTAVEQVERKQGWQSPKEILKVGAITIGSLLTGGLIVEAIDPEVAEEALRLAMTGEDVEPLMNALESLADSSTEASETSSGAARAVVATAILAPVAYSGVALSRRKVRLQLTTDDNKYVEIVAPEAAAAFIEASHIVTRQNGNGEPPASD